MTTRIGILSIKGSDYHPSRRLPEAAKERNAEVVVIDPYALALSYREGGPVLLPGEPVAGLDALLPRQGAEIKTAALAVIGHFEQTGICVINRLSGILKARNKYLASQALLAAGIAVPDTVYATSEQVFRLACDAFAPGPAVVKPVSGRQGSGIHLLEADAALPPDVEAELAASRGVLVQAFIPPKGRKDVRALVAGGQVIGAVSLTPPAGDFRANVHVGSTLAAFDIPDDLANLACRAVSAIGLDIAGVDLMISPQGQPMIVEVNYAPGFKGLEAATRIDVAGNIMEYVLAKIGRSKKVR